MNGDQINEKINELQQKTSTVEYMVSELMPELKRNTETMHQLAVQFAAYATKHDTVSAKADALQVKVDKHSEQLAANQPVIDGVRGLFWKIITATITGGFGLAAIALAIYKGAVE